jgi:Golgi-body localisation protein domain/RNA pol II promoter Fmp27 protein domain
MVLTQVAVYLTSLSLTTLVFLATAALVFIILRRKGYGVTLHLGSLEITALRGSRRFPDGARVRVSSRIAHFLLTGCRGPWLDLSTARFVMRLRPAPRSAARPAAASSALRRSFAHLSAALAVESAYSRVIAHNFCVAAVVFFLRGVRLRAERVHIWRQGAHWAFKADQFVYTGHAVGVFGSRYDMSVNELSLLADLYPVGVAPPDEPDDPRGDGGSSGDGSGGSAASGGGGDDAAPSDPAAQLAAAIAAAALARSASADVDSARLFMSVPEDHAAMPQPALTPHSSSAAITTFVLPQPPPASTAAPAPTPTRSPPPGAAAGGTAPAAALPAPLPAPLRVSLVLRKGVHLSAVLAPRALTVLRPRRMAIMDDITLSLDVRDVSARASHVASLRLGSATLKLCPGYSRNLRAKLPPSAPSTRRPRKPGLLRYWEVSGTFTGLYARLVPPPMPLAPYSLPYGGSVSTDPSASTPPPMPPPLSSAAESGSMIGGGGLFANVKSMSFDACGMAADERQEAMCKASLAVEHVFAGSTAVESTAQDKCESLARFAPPLPQSPRISSSRPGSRGREFRSGNLRWMGEGEDGNGREGGCVAGTSNQNSVFDDVDEDLISETECESEAGYNKPLPLDPDAVLALEAFVKARPEAVLWLAGVAASFDMNCAKRDAVRFDVTGDGAVVAVEPTGLLRIIRNALAFSRGYTVTGTAESMASFLSPAHVPSPGDSVDYSPSLSPPAVTIGATVAEMVVPAASGSQGEALFSSLDGRSAGALGERTASGNSHAAVSRSTSLSSMGSDGGDIGERGALMFGCDLKRCHAIVLGDGPVGEGDTLALIFGAEKVTVPRMIRSGVKSGGFLFVCEVENLRVDHWSQWARTANLVCEHGSFSNVSKSSDERRVVNVVGLAMDWDFDLQSALEELPERFLRLRRVSGDPALVEYTRALNVFAAAWVSSPTLLTVPTLAAFLSPTLSTDAIPARSPRTPSAAEGKTRRPRTMPPTGAARFDADAAALAEVEKRERRERRRKRFLVVLDSWMFSGTDVCVAASFPDGPRMSARAAEVPSFHLSDERYILRHIVVELSGTQCMYAEEFSVRNPIHSMGRLSARRHIDIVVTTFRALLSDDYWFGLLLQDWIVRLKAVLKVSREARYRRRRLPMPRYRKKPFPDLHLFFSDVKIAIADHPIDAFLTKALPLMQDEAIEREKRYCALGATVKQRKQNKSISTDGIRRLKAALAEEDSAIYVRRMKAHMAALDDWSIAPGFLPRLAGPPQSQLTATTLKLELTMDDGTRKFGSSENIRKLKLLDTYLLGPQKLGRTRQYESDAWNSLGFRDLVFDATCLELRFRDFPSPFMAIDRLYFDKGALVGQGQEAMVAPHLIETTVAIGRRRLVKIVKSLASSKTFADLHLIADTMRVTYNPAYIGSVVLFGRAFGRFLAGGKNPSPRMAWFDSTRLSQHGQLRITARSFKGIMTSSSSPYTDTDHFVNVAADDVSMLMSRLPPTEQDLDPISWEVHNWRFYPRVFREDMRSAIAFKYVKLGLNPVPRSLSGDPQDHYIFPLTTREQVSTGETGTGRALMTPFKVDVPVVASLNPTGCYTNWMSPLVTDGNPSYDSYAQFRTDALHLGIRIVIRQAPDVIRPASTTTVELSPLAPPDMTDFEDPAPFWAPEGASLVHSDAITTIRKVVGRITRRPISNRAPPRWDFPGRKRPCLSGFGHRMTSLDLDLDVRDMNVMLYNNFEIGHGMFVSVQSVRGGISKVSVRIPSDDPDAIDGYRKETRLVRQHAELDDVFVAMRMPELDFADGVTQCGSLFSLQSLRLSRQDIVDKDSDAVEAKFYPGPSRLMTGHGAPGGMSSAFADVNETSPFYTFSSNHMLQRGKPLDKVSYKQVLSIDGVRILWSPLRRNSVLAWPDAFAEKNFIMKGVSSSGGRDDDPLHEDVIVEQRILVDSQEAPISTRGGTCDGGDGTSPIDPVDGNDFQGLARWNSLNSGSMMRLGSVGSTGLCTLTNAGSIAETCDVDGGDDADGAGNFSLSENDKSDELRSGAKAHRLRRPLALRSKAIPAQPDGPLRRAATAGDLRPLNPAASRLAVAKRVDGDLIDLIEPQLVEEVSREPSRLETRKPAETGVNQSRRIQKGDRLEQSQSDEYLRDGNRSGPSIGDDSGSIRPSALTTSLRSVLNTDAKFQLLVNDSQVCFGAAEADALVVLTSESAGVGFVDKTIEQRHQLGGSSERWIDAEHRVLLQRSRVYILSEDLQSFRFHERWVPREADALEDEAEVAKAIAPLTRVTVRPISFNVLYVRAKSISKEDDDGDVDNVLRPAQLYINVPYVSMDSTRAGFHAVTDVVRKVLMLRVPNSEVIKEELAELRFNMQLAGGSLSPSELADYGRRLKNITSQILYAGETFQPDLVKALMRQEDGDFTANLIRYKARAKAVATYMRSESRARGTSELYPTMYISYSFDQCSWQLRDFKTNRPFVELIMTDLVCRHIFYVGKGMTSEFTFGNIHAINHQEGGFYKGILHPSGDPLSQSVQPQLSSKIKASDGTSVAFRWFATQMESVGGIPVYDLLTINLSPLNAAISSNLSKAVFEFAFGTRDLGDVRKIVTGVKSKGVSGSNSSATVAGAGSSQAAIVSNTGDRVGAVIGNGALGRSGSMASLSSLRGNGHADGHPVAESVAGSAASKRPGFLRRRRAANDGVSGSSVAGRTSSRLSAVMTAPLHARTRSQDVQEMSQRGESTMIFKYIYIGEFQLTASYKKKEDPEAHSIMDITDLTVNSPSYMYSSQVWTWRNFAQQVKKELLLSFAVRGVSNLAKLKLLPGYQLVRRRVRQGTDTVSGLRHGIFDRSSAQSTPGDPGDYIEELDGSERGRTDSIGSGSDEDNANHERADAKHLALSNELLGSSDLEEEKRRRLVLQVLFGPRSGAPASAPHDSPSVSQGQPHSEPPSSRVSSSRPPADPRSAGPAGHVRGKAFLHRRI